ncbi:MAG: C39 family peptidase [Akkermansiaceae bacterium]
MTIAIAIPNTIIGGLAQVDSPLNGQDVTERILSADVWSGARELPGKWRLESTVAGAKTSHLLALPKVLGEDVVLLRAVRREGRLDSLVVTFADAGSYFQYQPNVAKDQLAARRKALVERQRQFAELYQARHERITERLEAMSKARVKRAKQGASRALRAELKVYQVGGLKLGLLADGNRIIRLTISREIAHEKSWLDESIQKMNANSRGAYFRSQVKEDANGDSIIASVPVVPQGYKPYCGINTLVMTAHYFGLHLDEDWLAVAGKFQNTGSAGNSNMFGLYNAVAKEARLKISRETEFDFRKARALMRDGMPVIVWRKFDYRRNQLHNKISRRMIKDPHAKLPEPNADDRAKWPGKDHPVHASVIVGFNDERKEVLFLESWAGVTSPRRMRYEEMEATATWAFYFRNR